MQELNECERAFAEGDSFFQGEYEKWHALETELKIQGYSYAEVEALKEHYRSEIARLRLVEKELAREIRTAKAIQEEIVQMEQRTADTREPIKEQEKKLDKTQPKR